MNTRVEVYDLTFMRSDLLQSVLKTYHRTWQRSHQGVCSVPLFTTVVVNLYSTALVLSLFYFNYVVTQSSHHSSDKRLTELSIKQTQHFSDITFQCSSSTLNRTKGLGTMKTTCRRSSKCISSVNL